MQPACHNKHSLVVGKRPDYYFIEQTDHKLFLIHGSTQQLDLHKDIKPTTTRNGSGARFSLFFSLAYPECNYAVDNTMNEKKSKSTRRA